MEKSNSAKLGPTYATLQHTNTKTKILLGKYLILRGADWIPKSRKDFPFPFPFYVEFPFRYGRQKVIIGESRIHVYVHPAFIITFRSYRAITSIKVHKSLCILIRDIFRGYNWHTRNPGIPQRDWHETGKKVLTAHFPLTKTIHQARVENSSLNGDCGQG